MRETAGSEARAAAISTGAVEGYDVGTGEPWDDSWQPVAQGWMSQDQIAKARAMEAAKYGVSS